MKLPKNRIILIIGILLENKERIKNMRDAENS